MTRNVLNVLEIEDFLDGISPPDDGPIRRWFLSVARRWILRHHQPALEIRADLHTRTAAVWDQQGRTLRTYDLDTPLPPAWMKAMLAEGAVQEEIERDRRYLPDWARKALLGGEILHSVLITQELADACALIAEYFQTQQNPRLLQRLQNISWDSALEHAQRWKERAEAEALRALMEERNTLHVFGNGYRIVHLTTSEDLDEEGRLMNHWVGSYAMDVYYNRCDIFSLRDERGKPHATVEYVDGRVYQVRGRANGPVHERYRWMLRSFLSELGATVEHDGENIDWPFARDRLIVPHGVREPAPVPAAEINALVQANAWVAGDLGDWTHSSSAVPDMGKEAVMTRLRAYRGELTEASRRHLAQTLLPEGPMIRLDLIRTLDIFGLAVPVWDVRAPLIYLALREARVITRRDGPSVASVSMAILNDLLALAEDWPIALFHIGRPLQPRSPLPATLRPREPQVALEPQPGAVTAVPSVRQVLDRTGLEIASIAARRRQALAHAIKPAKDAGIAGLAVGRGRQGEWNTDYGSLREILDRPLGVFL